jgi:hypothetical protein
VNLVAGGEHAGTTAVHLAALDGDYPSVEALLDFGTSFLY